MHVGGRRLVFAVVALVAALTLCATAWADNYRFRFNPADQAAARAALLRRADLGTTVTWTGGAKKPDLSPPPTCPNYHPKTSDLVVTGAAESDFSTAGLELDTEVEVLQTAAMVRLDWQRTVTPALLPCLRARFGGGPQTKLLSLEHIGFPQVATYTTAVRLLMDVTKAGKTVRVMVDFVAIGRGRTEITLTTSAPYASRQVVSAAEVRLARVLVGRVRTGRSSGHVA